MSGHSKWHNIKRKKEATDAKKSKVFSKMARYITVAAKKGGGDPEMNPALRLAIENAKKARMPKEGIQKAIQKGIGGGAGDDLFEMTYEGFGPGGVGFIVNAITDNKNRTVAEIKNLFSRYGGSLGTPGSVSYMFDAETKEPTYKMEITDASLAEKLGKLEDDLDDHDDVQDFISNYEAN